VKLRRPRRQRTREFRKARGRARLRNSARAWHTGLGIGYCRVHTAPCATLCRGMRRARCCQTDGPANRLMGLVEKFWADAKTWTSFLLRRGLPEHFMGQDNSGGSASGHNRAKVTGSPAGGSCPRVEPSNEERPVSLPVAYLAECRERCSQRIFGETTTRVRTAILGLMDAIDYDRSHPNG
jgi:hypothetical protein